MSIQVSPLRRRMIDDMTIRNMTPGTRTAVLGGHVERCEDCVHTRIAYNCCRYRHRPKCPMVGRHRTAGGAPDRTAACSLLPSRVHAASDVFYGLC